MDNFYVEGVRYLRCNVCSEFPEIVKRITNQKLPAIVTQSGTKYRNNIYQDHKLKDFHAECVKAHNLKNGKEALTMSSAPMDALIKRANSEQADHIGNLFISVFTDAKKLTLSAWSWPSRCVALEAGKAFHYNEPSKPTIPPNVNLQYINPGKHCEILQCIVESNQKNLVKKINDALAVSLRADGSVDLTQIDKIYVMAKIINMDGSKELVFIGISEQTESGASGLLDAVKAAVKQHFPDEKVFWRKLSSMVTDGAKINSGEKAGLWVLLQKL